MLAKSPARMRQGAGRLPLFALAVLASVAAAAAQNRPLTLPAFRALLREQASGEKQAPNLEATDEAFLRLLSAQGREAAARQSLDRLSGWYKAAQARLQAQNTPASDVDALRFAVIHAAARVARFQAARLAASQKVNLLLRQPAGSPLTAVMEGPAAAAAPPAEGQKPEAAAAAAPKAGAAEVPEIGADLASRKAAYENQLLPLGSELLRKMYQSYLFGGVPLSSLLWQEQQVYGSDLEYRQLLVEAAKDQAGGR